MIDLQKYLDNIDQSHYDRWIEGRYSVSDLVEKHKLIALMFRKKILDAIEEHSPSEMISKFKKECPNIEIKEREKALERIEEECEDIKDIL